jgi:hypothetical protein
MRNEPQDKIYFSDDKRGNEFFSKFKNYYNLYSYPLYQNRALFKRGVSFISYTAGDRGNDAVWEISDGKFYLVEITGLFQIQPPGTKIKITEDAIPATLYSVFGPVRDRIPATWYTGNLLIKERDDFKASEDLKHIVVPVKKGICEDRSIVSDKEFDKLYWANVRY